MGFTKTKGVNAIIYIINLDRAIERKKSVEQELLKTDIPFQFISAVNINTVDTLKHKVLNGYKRPLIPAEVACFLSHFKVKELFLKSKYDFAIIIEDDIQLLKDFDSLVKKAMKQHLSLSKKHQWDVLKLPTYGKKKLFKIKEIDANYSLYGGSVVITTMAAIWSRKGVEKFLEKAVKNDCRIINMPIDCALQKPWKYNLNITSIAL